MLHATIRERFFVSGEGVRARFLHIITAKEKQRMKTRSLYYTAAVAAVFLCFFGGANPAYAWCPYGLSVPAEGGGWWSTGSQFDKGGRGTGDATPPAAPTAPAVAKPIPKIPIPPSAMPPDKPQATPSGQPAAQPSEGEPSSSVNSAGKPTAIQQAENASRLWETWWLLNQDRFLGLRKSNPFEKTEDGQNGDVIISREKEYRELWDFLAANLQNKEVDLLYPSIVALAKTGDKFASQEIEKFWDTKERDILDAVIIGMGMLKDPSQAEKLLSFLKDTKNHKVTRGFAAFSLGYINHKPAIDMFRQIISDDAEDWEVRCSCEMAMGLMRSADSTDFLAGILNSNEGRKTNNNVRAYAALALGRIAGEAAEAPLKTAIEDSNEEVRRCAVIAVGNAKYAGCKDLLIKAMESDKDIAVMCFAAISLGELGDESAYEPLVKALRSTKNIEVQGFAALGLGMLGNKSPSAVKPLRDLLGNAREFESLRCAATLALGMLKDKDSINALIKEAGKKQLPKLRKYSVLALGLIGEADEDVVKAVKDVMAESRKRMADIYKYSICSLTMLGETKAVIKQLKDDLKSENMDIKLAVIDLMGRIGDKTTADSLISVYKNEKQKIVRQVVLGSIGCLLDRNYEFPLLKNITTHNDYYLQLLVVNHVLYIP